MSSGAPPTVIEDGTPLHGPDIDVPARVAWLLRMSRLTAPGGAPSLRTTASELGTSVSRIHRLETGQLRSGALVDGYERLLGRPAGSLRAPIDVLCRTFPRLSPPDQDPGRPTATVRELSALTERVMPPYERPVAGGDWLAWARALSGPGSLGLPDWIARDLARVLTGEMNRSVGAAYPMRYEALALLRTGPYGEVVLDVAREAIADPHVQVLNDMMSAVGEAATPDAVAWCLELLADPRDRVLVGAVLALENMGTVSSDPHFWDGLADVLLDHLAAAEHGTQRWRWLSHLVRLVPAAVLSSRQQSARAALAPTPRVESWSRSRSNQHWADSEARARRVTDALGLVEQPMLARLVFDIVVSPYESHAVTSYMLLSGLPEVADLVCEQLVGIAETHPDPVLRERVGRRVTGMVHPTMPTLARTWLAGDTELRDRALLMAGCVGMQVPADVLRAALGGSAASRAAALHAAGMAGHPLLGELAADPDAEVAGGAAWWLARGCRVTEQAG